MIVTRNKKKAFVIALALIAVSIMFVVMTGEESSAADPPYYDVHNATELKETIEEASGDEKRIIVIKNDIILTETLVIQVNCRDITLTTDCGATIKASDDFNKKSGWENNLLDLNVNIKHSDDKQSEFKIGLEPTDDPEKTLTLDGNGQCRVIRQRFASTTLVLNAGIITGGMEQIGGGIFMSHGSAFKMYGGTVNNNNIFPSTMPNSAAGTDYDYSKDLFFSAGTNAYIYGGTVGSIFHRADKDCVGANWGTHVYGGTIENVYIFSYPNGNVSTFTYHKEPGSPGGTVGHVYLATLGHNNDTDTFDHTEIKQPFTNNEPIKPGDHVAKVNGFGYKTIEEAIENANDGDTIYIVNNANITRTYNVNKNVKFVVAPDYETDVNDKGNHSPKPKVNGEFPSTQYVIQNQQNLMISISIDLNGGSMDLPTGWTNNGGTYTKSYPYGTPHSDVIAEIDKTPTISGYSFVEWSPSTGKVGDVAPVISAMYNFSYTIALDKGINGEEDKNATVVYGDTALTSFTDIVAIYTEGFTLDGYYTAAEGGTRILHAGGTFASDNIDGYIVNGKWIRAENCKLYAQWERHWCKITVDGINMPCDVNLQYFDTNFTSHDGAVKEGYTLRGYFTSDNGNTMIADADRKFVGTVDGYITDGKWIGGNKTLIAIFDPITYDIILDKGTGDKDGSAKVVFDSTTIPSEFDPATKKGYSVEGYYTTEDNSGSKILEADGSLVNENIGEYISGGKWIKAEDNIRLYAHWVPNVYDIILHHGGQGKAHGLAKVAFDGTYAKIDSHATKSGHKVTGYYTQAAGGVKVLNADGSFATTHVESILADGKWNMDTGHTLYAQWEIDSEEHKEMAKYVAIIALESLIIIGALIIYIRRK